MKRVAVVVAALLGCDGDESSEIDAAVGVDAAASVDAGVDAAPTLLDGGWTLTWTCEDGCGGSPARPAITVLQDLEVDGTHLRWHAACVNCTFEHDGQGFNEHCLDVGRGVDDGMDRDPYTICEAGGAVTAAITWRNSFGAATRWAVAGVR